MASSTVEESLPAPEDEVPEGFELPSVVSDEDRPPSLLQNCPSPTTDKMSFSNAIDEIGMGPFQSRLTVLCGMVRVCLCVRARWSRAHGSKSMTASAR